MLAQKSGPLDSHEHSGNLARVSFHTTPGGAAELTVATRLERLSRPLLCVLS